MRLNFPDTLQNFLPTISFRHPFIRFDYAANGRIIHRTDPTGRDKQNDLDNRRYLGRWDRALDNDIQGPRWLGQPEIAQIVAEALQFRDGKVYDLLIYCIMPNHVHFVGRIDNPTHDEQPIPLHKIMQSLKRHTARQANLKLGRQGAFWQEESLTMSSATQVNWSELSVMFATTRLKLVW